MADIPIGRLIARLGLDPKQFNREMTSAERRLAIAGRNLQRVGKQLSAGLTAPLALAAAGIAKVGQDFEREFVKIETLVGVSREQLAAWRQDVIALGPATGQGPRQLAEALFVVTSAGERGAAAMEILERSAKASAIGLGETAEVARAITSAVQAFRKQNLDAATAADVLVATVREGNLAAEDLAGSLGRVIGIAAEMGVTFADVGGFVASFTRVGVSAEEAVTALRGVLATLAKPTTETEVALAQLGRTAADLQQEIGERGLARTFVSLVEQAQSAGVSLAAIIPNVRALSGVLATASSQGEAFIEIADNVADSTGILAEAFATAEARGVFAFDQLGASIEALVLALADAGLLTFVRDLAVDLRDLADGLAALDRDTQQVILAFSGFLAVIGPVTLALGLLAAAVAAVGFPLFGLVVIIGATAAAVIAFGDDVDEMILRLDAFVQRGVARISEALADLARNLAELAEEASVLPFIGDTIAAAAPGLRQLASEFAANAARAREMADAQTAAADALGAQAGPLQSIQQVLADLETAWKKATDAAGAHTGTLTDAQKAIQQTVIDAGVELAQLTRLRDAYLESADAVRAANVEIEVHNALLGLGKEATDDQRAAIEALARATAQRRQEIKDLEDLARDRLREQEQLAKDREKILLEPFLEASREIENTIADSVRNALDGSLDSFEDFGDDVVEIFKDVFANTVASIITSSIQGAIQSAISRLNLESLIGAAAPAAGTGTGTGTGTAPPTGILAGIGGLQGLGARLGFGLGGLGLGASLSGSLFTNVGGVGGDDAVKIASLVGGAVGGIIGGIFGGPVGAGLGGLAGSFGIGAIARGIANQIEVGSPFGLAGTSFAKQSRFSTALAVDPLGTTIAKIFGLDVPFTSFLDVLGISPAKSPTFQILNRSFEQASELFEKSLAVETPFATVGLSRDLTRKLDATFVEGLLGFVEKIDEAVAAVLDDAQTAQVATGLQGEFADGFRFVFSDFDNEIFQVAVARADAIIRSLFPQIGEGSNLGPRIGTVTTAIDNIIGSLEGKPFSQAATPEFLENFVAFIEARLDLLEGIQDAIDPDRFSEAQRAISDLNDEFDELRIAAKQLAFSEAELAQLEVARSEALERLATDFEQSVADQLLALTDPFALAVQEQLRLEEERLRNARDFGIDLLLVEELNAKERERLLEGFARNAKALLDELTATPSSPLAPLDVLANAEAIFEDLRQQVVGGDFSKIDELTAAAANLLEISRSVFASSDQFFERFNFIVATLENVTNRTDLPGFATGGSFTVPGGGVDNVVPLFRVSGGETVSVARRSEGAEASRAGAALTELVAQGQIDEALARQVLGAIENLERSVRRQAKALERLAARVA